MPVTGGRAVAAALRRYPEIVRQEVEEALQRAAQLVLEEMRRLTPIDPSSTTHARDALTVAFQESGLTAKVGLTTAALTSDFFWFRFLDLGTKGGEVRYRVRGTREVRTMQTPARPALHIRERAMDLNRDDVERLIRAALADALRRGRR